MFQPRSGGRIQPRAQALGWEWETTQALKGRKKRPESVRCRAPIGTVSSWTGKLVRNLDGFINNDRPRRRRISHQLGNRSPHDISVHRRHPVHAPVVGMLFDHLVNLRSTIAGHSKDIVGKSLNFASYVAAPLPERRAHFRQRLFPQISLKQHLQSQFARFAAGTHWPSAISPQPSVYRKQRRQLWRRLGFAFLGRCSSRF